MVKDEMENMIARELEKGYQIKTKLRFLKDKQFQMEKYLEKYGATKCKEIMELRLNMIDVKANFKGKHDDETVLDALNK